MQAWALRQVVTRCRTAPLVASSQSVGDRAVHGHGALRVDAGPTGEPDDSRSAAPRPRARSRRHAADVARRPNCRATRRWRRRCELRTPPRGRRPPAGACRLLRGSGQRGLGTSPAVRLPGARRIHRRSSRRARGRGPTCHCGSARLEPRAVHPPPRPLCALQRVAERLDRVLDRRVIQLESGRRARMRAARRAGDVRARRDAAPTVECWWRSFADASPLRHGGRTASGPSDPCASHAVSSQSGARSTSRSLEPDRGEQVVPPLAERSSPVAA